MKTRAILIWPLLFIAAATIVWFAAASWRGTRKFNDSDLIPQRAYVPAESNAFCTLSRVTNDFYWPDSLADKLDALSNDRAWDDLLATDVLEKNHACLAWFDQSFQLQFLDVEEPTPPGQPHPHLGALKAIGRLACLRAVQLFHAHKQREAFDVALKILDFGHRLEDSGGDTMHYLLGASIRSLALQRIRQMTPRTDLPEAELVRVIRTLDKFGANERGLSNALKVQYQLESKLLDDFAAGRWEALEITNSPSERVTLSNEMKRVFNAEKTRAKFAATIRLLLKNISEPFCNVAWPEYSKTKTVGLAWLQWAVQGKHNAQGDVWLAMNIPSLKKFFERKSRENVDVRGTQLLLALKIFVARRGHLPASLTELTPEFFPKVPLDDFDGQPFRYLPGEKLIYSVGPGGKRFPRSKIALPFEIKF